jgi:hypothetical protein
VAISPPSPPPSTPVRGAGEPEHGQALLELVELGRERSVVTFRK